MFNEISSTVIFALIGGVTAILLYLIFLSWRNPVLAKLGLRSLARRPLQTALIVLGLTLSTIIVISALGTGDTLRYSVQRQSVAAYGRVDEIIAPPIISLLASVGDPNADSLDCVASTTFNNPFLRQFLELTHHTGHPRVPAHCPLLLRHGRSSLSC